MYPATIKRVPRRTRRVMKELELVVSVRTPDSVIDHHIPIGFTMRTADELRAVACAYMRGMSPVIVDWAVYLSPILYQVEGDRTLWTYCISQDTLIAQGTEL